jgi:hypothetical protein
MCLFSLTAWAQADELEKKSPQSRFARHVFSVSLFGGLQSLSAGLPGNGNMSAGLGGGGRIGYSYSINHRWSIVSGAGISFYTTSLEYTILQHSYTAYNENSFINDSYTFDYTVQGYTENHSEVLLEIPLMARLTTVVGSSGQSLRIAGGLSLGMPLNARYTLAADKHNTTRVYCGLEGIEYPADAVAASNHAVSSQTGNMETTFAFQLCGEIDYRFPLSATIGLAVGAYAGYGLSNMQGTNNKPFVTYSVLSADTRDLPPQYTYTGSVLNTALVSAVNPWSVGIKISIELGSITSR